MNVNKYKYCYLSWLWVVALQYVSRKGACTVEQVATFVKNGDFKNYQPQPQGKHPIRRVMYDLAQLGVLDADRVTDNTGCYHVYSIKFEYADDVQLLLDLLKQIDGFGTQSKENRILNNLGKLFDHCGGKAHNYVVGGKHLSSWPAIRDALVLVRDSGFEQLHITIPLNGSDNKHAVTTYGAYLLAQWDLIEEIRGRIGLFDHLSKRQSHSLRRKYIRKEGK